ncbi:hypothetical protein [Nostoc sp.]|uniref:hypothetical protein n=1 Tax=Nostoc sp. TaxID=1180 RepID=UPI002FF7FCD1
MTNKSTEMFCFASSALPRCDRTYLAAFSALLLSVLGETPARYLRGQAEHIGEILR